MTKVFVVLVCVVFCVFRLSSAAPALSPEQAVRKEVDNAQVKVQEDIKSRMEDSVQGALKKYRSVESANDVRVLEDENDKHGDTVAYKFNNLGATVTKFRDPEYGDSTKTAVSYIIVDRPEYHSAITGFRTNTVLDNGTRVSNAGASYDVRKENGDYLSIGGTKPDDAPDGHILAHLAARRTLVSNGRQKIDFEGRATRVIGGKLNGKQQLKFNLGLSQNL